MEGERVVSHGAFVLDADQQIRGGVSMMSLDDDASAYDEQVEVTSEEREQLARVVERYLAVQSALASDEAETAKTQAKALDRVGREVELSSEGAPEAWERVRAPLLEHTATLAEASSLDAMRKAFAAASEAVERLLATFGNPLREALHVAYCPMAFDDEGAEWVQRGETIDNSYFGPAMQSCGELRRTAHPGAGFGSEAPGEGSSPPGQEDSRGGDAQGGHDRGADSQGAHSHEGHAH
jgi:Cu(I)/Ag(I) efflux system membrane fusion protein